MKLFPVLVIALCALGFLAFGLWLFADPVGALSKVGIASTSATGTIELRAFYGGMELGLGLFLGWCALRPEWQSAGLWLVLLANRGAALARLLGIPPAWASLGRYLGWAVARELGVARLLALAALLRPA